MGTVRVERCPECQALIGEGMLYEHQQRHCTAKPAAIARYDFGDADAFGRGEYVALADHERVVAALKRREKGE
jgi:hypothetical protein